jgi:hypothetical protein
VAAGMQFKEKRLHVFFRFSCISTKNGNRYKKEEAPLN